MATYKVIQDVEAEDKILGPLTLKQMIFATITVAFMFVAFRLVVATGTVFIAIPFLPFILVFGVLAAPLGKDQPTDIWLAAQIRFYTKPRKRIWDQSDLKQLVTITAPVREERQYTDGLNQSQVRSRLRALASTLDSRGWAVKNASVNDYAPLVYGQKPSDRLINPASLPQAVMGISSDVSSADDILDVQHNETAAHFEQLMQESSKQHHSQVLEEIRQASEHTREEITKQRQQEEYWFMHQNSNPTPKDNNVMFEDAVVQPGQAPLINAVDEPLTQEQKDILAKAKSEKERMQASAKSHHKMILTMEQQEQLSKEKLREKQQRDAEIAAEKARQEAIRLQKEAEQRALDKTRLSKADKIELANANNLKVSTVQGLAKHKTQEVVIELHKHKNS